MTYATTNPPVCVQRGGLDGTMPAQWFYKSTDAAATVDTSGYITDGGSRGMQVNDLLYVLDTTNHILTTHLVATVSSTYPGAIDLRDGTTIGSATNTD